MNERIKEQIKNRLAELGFTKEYIIEDDNTARMFLYAISAPNVESVESIDGKCVIKYKSELKND